MLAYRRWQNLDPILDVCRSAGVTKIFIHIDAGTSSEEKIDVSLTLEKARAYKEQHGMDICIASQTTNLGCAVSMISSLDTIFRTEDQVIVLEDDCIPTFDFFKFMNVSFREMEMNPNIGLACGTQFAPTSVTGGEWLLSLYPFNWGWGISKSNWALLSSKMLGRDKLKYRGSGFSSEEIAYWNAGARRALEGYVDVWDTLLVREMIRHKIFSVLPGTNLVRNVGNDAHALHTMGNQSWTNYPTGNFSVGSTNPKFNIQFNVWARTRFYQISRRHLYSTKITYLVDLLLTKRKRKPIRERIHLGLINFEK